MNNTQLLKAIRKTYLKIKEINTYGTKEYLKCTCSSFALQYNGGCCCKVEDKRKELTSKLDELILAITE